MKKENNTNLYQFITLVVLILLGIGSTHYVISQIPEKVTASILAIEYDKVGGMENYVKINKIQREQTELFLKQYEAQNGEIQAQAKAQNNTEKTVKNNSGKKISLELAKKVTGENTYILGNPDAEISFIEYSDLECPFCKRLHQAGTIDEIIENYDGKVNFIFKQFPLGFHAQAQMESEAVLCAGDLAGTDKYYEFVNLIYSKSKADGNSFTKESIAKLGTTIGIDEKNYYHVLNQVNLKNKLRKKWLNEVIYLVLLEHLEMFLLIIKHENGINYLELILMKHSSKK